MSPVTRRAGHSHHTATHAGSSYSWEVGKRTPSTPPAPGRSHRKAARGPDRICPAHPVGQATERTPSTAEISTAPRPHPSHGHAHAFFLSPTTPLSGPRCTLPSAPFSGLGPHWSASCSPRVPSHLPSTHLCRVWRPSLPRTTLGADYARWQSYGPGFSALDPCDLTGRPGASRLPRDLPIGERDRDPKGPSAPWRWLCPPPLGTSGARWS